MLYYLGLCKYTLWRSHNDEIALTTRFSERIPVVKWRIPVPNLQIRGVTQMISVHFEYQNKPAFKTLESV